MGGSCTFGMTGDIARPRRKNRYLRKKTDTKKERTATKGGKRGTGGRD